MFQSLKMSNQTQKNQKIHSLGWRNGQMVGAGRFVSKECLQHNMEWNGMEWDYEGVAKMVGEV